MLYSTKVRLRPSDEQIAEFEACVGAQRFYWNQLLQMWNELHEAGEKLVRGRQVRDLFRQQRRGGILHDKDGVVYDDLSFLDRCPGNLLESSCEHLQRAWDGFFRKKQWAKNRPRFKAKKTSKKSFTIYKKNDTTFRLEQQGDSFLLRLPKLKHPIILEEIRFSDHLTDVKMVTISEDAYGWRASLTYELGSTPREIAEVQLSDSGLQVGIDLGLKDFATLSVVDEDGRPYKVNIADVIPGVQVRLETLTRRVAQLQRALAEKKETNPDWKSSKRRERVKTKLAVAYARLSFLRRDFVEKFSKWIVENFHSIAVEDLAVSNMMRNRKLSARIHTSMWYSFLSRVKAKCEMYGRRVVTADRFFPSSKRCSCCGNVRKELKLSERTYHCENVACGVSLDRDWNAARNLEGLLAV